MCSYASFLGVVEFFGTFSKTVIQLSYYEKKYGWHFIAYVTVYALTGS